MWGQPKNTVVMQEAKGRVYFLKWMDDFADCYLRWIVEAGISEIDLPILARHSKWNWIGSDWTAYIKGQLILHFGWGNKNTNYSNCFLLIYDMLSASRGTSAFLTLIETIIKLVLINVALARFLTLFYCHLFHWMFLCILRHILHVDLLWLIGRWELDLLIKQLYIYFLFSN